MQTNKQQKQNYRGEEEDKKESQDKARDYAYGSHSHTQQNANVLGFPSI